MHRDGSFIQLYVAKQRHEVRRPSMRTSEWDSPYHTMLCNWRHLSFKQYLYIYGFGTWWERVLYSRMLWWRVLQRCLHIRSVPKSLLWVSSAVGWMASFLVNSGFLKLIFTCLISSGTKIERCGHVVLLFQMRVMRPGSARLHQRNRFPGPPLTTCSLTGQLVFQRV